MASEQNWTPTIKASHDFRADVDAQNLYDAVVSKGPDTSLIIEILTKRSNFQRQLIKAAYEHKYKQTLEESLGRTTKGDFQEVINALLDPPDVYDAKMVHNSISSKGSGGDVLLADILCTKSNDEIRRLQNAYRAVFDSNSEKANLVDAVKQGTSSDLRKLLVPIAAGDRSEDRSVDVARAKRDANHLYEAGEKKYGTDEDVFQSILGTQNYAQIEQLMREYEALRKHGLDVAIDKEFSGAIKHAYMAILQCVQNHHVYFSNALYQSMKGLGTSDDRLMWLIVSRSEIDLGEIKVQYERMFGRSLDKWVTDDTSGNYRDALLAVIKGNH